LYAEYNRRVMVFNTALNNAYIMTEEENLGDVVWRTGCIFKWKSEVLEGQVASTRENQGVWVTSSIYKGKSGGLVASTRVNQEVWGTGSIYKGKSGGLDDR
jgi:hypothetical protein